MTMSTFIDGPAPFTDTIMGQRRLVGVMGTVFSLDIRDLDLASPAVDRLVAWWQWVDHTFSTYRHDSAISELGAGTRGIEECPDEVREVLARCMRAVEASRGYFTAHPHGSLDPTGLVKGWSVELGSRMLREAGSRSHCIAAGGDLRSCGRPVPEIPWRLGVVDPFDPHRVIAVVSGDDMAMATSGTAERDAHIVDPVLRRAPSELCRDLASVTLVGTDLTHIDAMATAAFAMGSRCRAWIETQPDLGALVVHANGETWSRSVPGGPNIEML